MTSDPVQLEMLETTLRTFDARVQWHAPSWSSASGLLWNRVYVDRHMLRDAVLLEKFSPRLGEDWDADLAQILEWLPRGRVIYWDTLVYCVRGLGLGGRADPGYVPQAEQIYDAFRALFGAPHSHNYAGWCEATAEYGRELLRYGAEKGLLVRTPSGWRLAPKRPRKPAAAEKAAAKRAAAARQRWVKREARINLIMVLMKALPGMCTPRITVSTVENKTIMALMQGKYRVKPSQMEARLRELTDDEDVIKAAMAIYKGATA